MKVSSSIIILILTFGVFSIINTEMGIIGILSLAADTNKKTYPEELRHLAEIISC